MSEDVQRRRQGVMVSMFFRWVVLVTFIAFTIGGNVLVCLAVGTSRRLRRISSCFVVALAVTDLLLGLLVLPLSATLELRGGRWPLGGAICNIYLSMDVTLGTASIFTLLAISVDRYLAISDPLSYTTRFTPARAAAAIMVIWILSFTMAFAPIYMGWNTADFHVQNHDWRIGDEGDEGRTCRYEWNNNYVLLGVFCIFFFPLLVMCGMYHRIFCMAREQVRRIRAATPSFTRSSTSLRGATLREHKATMTLAAVLGVFIICWLPYVVFFTCMGLRRETEPPRLAHSVVLWLGYFNSALNPILYPALNRDFRRAYGHLLRCRNPSKNTSISIRTSGKDRSIISNEFHSANECSKSSVETHLNQEG
ncbi:histamine receptor H2b [Pangasianodon hypophthalmus]|uniref:histamine receptor H2b n=1 Tax=Pangasianodon hypophthalmus TaxID=310915 RepID=UPI002307E338|nr:histamine receptor H2b [Pangasianodon hypophthalmus]